MAEQPAPPPRPKKEAPKAPRNPVAANAPWKPANYSEEIAGAIQALYRGDAQSHQQKMALVWIIQEAAGTFEHHYFPSERDTTFALGKAHVGQSILKMLNIDIEALIKRRR
jgi:hypothetical protein